MRRKVLTVANVLRVVKHNKVVAGVVIKNTLQLVGGLPHVLFPLRLEELEALARYKRRMLLLQVAHRRHTLVVGGVRDLTSDRNFYGRAIHLSLGHLKFNLKTVTK